MEFQIAEAAVELIKELAETENLTLADAFSAFAAESEMTTEQLSVVKGALFEQVTLGEMAQESLTNALYSVFVSGIEEEETKETAEGTKYKVRVKEKDSGSSYIRYATRSKIAELRADPKISSVELTDHGDDHGDKEKEEKREDDVKEGLDPVDKEELKGDHKDRKDKDIDNDGDEDDSDEYLHKRRKAVKKAIDKEDGDEKEEAKESLWDRYKAIQEAKKAKKSEDCGCDHEDEKEVKEAMDPRDEASMKVYRELQGKVDAKRRAKLNIRGNDSAEQKKRLEKKRGMKLDDHPQFKEEFVSEADLVDAGRENAGERSGKKLDGKGVDNKKTIKLMPKLGESAIVTEKAESKSQQRLFGMVRAAQKGEGASSAKVAELADRMGKRDVLDFAKTKQAGLPDKVEEVEPKVELDDAGMPIMEYSRNNATGPAPDDVAPPKDPEGPQGVKNPKGLPKKPKGGDRRPGVGPGAGL